MDQQIPTDIEMPIQQGQFDFRTLALKIGEIGKILHETYSEENQNTGEGFLQALKILEELRSMLNGSVEADLSYGEKVSLLQLLDYFEIKLKRRIEAVDGNDYNL